MGVSGLPVERGPVNTRNPLVTTKSKRVKKISMMCAETAQAT